MTSAAGGTPPQNPTPTAREAERRRSPIRKKTTTRTRDASGKEDVVMEEEKEGAFLLGEPTFLDLGGGRLRCVETGHELLAKDEEAYDRTKPCRLALIDAAVAKKKPPLNMFQPHPTSKSQLVCKLTGDSGMIIISVIFEVDIGQNDVPSAMSLLQNKRKWRSIPL
ncbi:unnamed protein product [Musa hybrid cultivar]